MSRIPFGLKDGRLVQVSEVARGLACSCVCPGCKHPLVARKGEKRMHYFAHYGVTPCSAAMAASLREAIWQILQASDSFKLPGWPNSYSAFNRCVIPPLVFSPEKIERDFYISIGVRADFALFYNGRFLSVFLKLHGELSDTTKSELVRLKQPSISIDLVPIVREYEKGRCDITMELLKSAVVEWFEDKKWIYHRRDDTSVVLVDSESISIEDEDLDDTYLTTAMEPKFLTVGDIESLSVFMPCMAHMDYVDFEGKIIDGIGKLLSCEVSLEAWLCNFRLEDRPCVRAILDYFGVAEYK